MGVLLTPIIVKETLALEDLRGKRLAIDANGELFNEGIKGIGPKKALKLVSDFGCIENMPSEVREALGPVVSGIREILLKPDVTDEYSMEFARPDFDGVLKFLCDEREFSRERVNAALERAFGQKPVDR